MNDIYNEVYGYNIPNDDISLQERLLLEKCCKDKRHYQLIKELLALQKTKSLMMRKYGLQNDIETRLDRYVNE